MNDKEKLAEESILLELIAEKDELIKELTTEKERKKILEQLRKPRPKGKPIFHSLAKSKPKKCSDKLLDYLSKREYGIEELSEYDKETKKIINRAIDLLIADHSRR